jgi:hypothetical protein
MKNLSSSNIEAFVTCTHLPHIFAVQCCCFVSVARTFLTHVRLFDVSFVQHMKCCVDMGILSYHHIWSVFKVLCVHRPAKQLYILWDLTFSHWCCWSYESLGSCFTGWIVHSVSEDCSRFRLGLPAPKDEGAAFLQNVAHYLSHDAVWSSKNI